MSCYLPLKRILMAWSGSPVDWLSGMPSLFGQLLGASLPWVEISRIVREGDPVTDGPRQLGQGWVQTQGLFDSCVWGEPSWTCLYKGTHWETNCLSPIALHSWLLHRISYSLLGNSYRRFCMNFMPAPYLDKNSFISSETYTETPSVVSSTGIPHRAK